MKHVPHVALLAALAAGCAIPHPPSPMPFDPVGPPAAAARGPAQEPPPSPARATPGATRAVPVGIGYTDDPDTTLLGVALDMPVAENWTIGPALQLGVTDHRTLIAPTVQAKLYFPVKSADDAIARLLPYVQGGAGIAWIDDDAFPGSDDDVSLLLQVGGGLRYRMTDTLSLGTQMQLNFLPSEVHDERYYFGWEVLQFVFAF